MKRTSIKTLSTALLLLLAASWAQADLVTYTNRTDFMNALQAGNLFDGFVDIPSGTTQVAPLSRAQNGFSYELMAIGNTNYAAQGVNYDGTAISAADGVDAGILLDAFSGNADAVGADFFLINDSANKASGTTLVVSLNGAAVTVPIASDGGSSAHQFVGFVATGGDTISSVSLSHGEGAGLFSAVDNVVVGVAEAIPEPATVGLISIFGISIIFIRRIFE